MDADYYINKLGLSRHVEGGAFRETYRSGLVLPHHALPAAFKGDRTASTHIYFLLKHGEFSALHRIASDEHWHFYEGNTLHIYEIEAGGNLTVHKLGRNPEGGESFHTVIRAGSWFGSRCEVEGGFSLAGCTVAPGFDFEDFELAEREKLLLTYPQHNRLIAGLTR